MCDLGGAEQVKACLEAVVHVPRADVQFLKSRSHVDIKDRLLTLTGPYVQRYASEPMPYNKVTSPTGGYFVSLKVDRRSY